MKEVVRKEVILLLDAGIIYLVKESDWVSPVHCVPKKVESLFFLMNTMNWFLQEPSLDIECVLIIGN
jgi:hypothetical protein